LLADYEEGTWTPTIIGTTTAGTATYATALGRYTKIGRMVQIEIVLSWSAGTGTGNLGIGNLPFTAISSAPYGALTISEIANVVMPALSYPTAEIINATSTIALYSLEVGGGALAYVAYDAAGYIVLGGTYTV
jgi:hypothetical protein